MAFLLVRSDVLTVIHGDTVIINRNSSAEPTILKNFESLLENEVYVENVSAQNKQDEVKMCCENDADGLEDADPPETTPDKVGKKDLSVICCCVSSCGQFLAISDEAKRLTVWKSASENLWDTLSTRSTARKCIRVCFTNSKELLLAADRAGDVYSFSISQPLEPGQLLLGHLSMLLDMVISRDDKFIITSDRDEKIRVSHFPNAYSIQSYCLGHSEFVSALCLYEMNTNWLISGSGDGTLRIWDFKAGLELCVHNYMPDISSYLRGKDCLDSEMKENPTEPSCQRISAVRAIQSAVHFGRLAVLFDKAPCLGVYKVQVQETGPTVGLIQIISYICEPWDMVFDSSSQLLTLTPIQSQIFNLYKLSGSDTHSKFQMLPNIEQLSEHKQLNEHLTSHWDTLKDCKKIDDLQHLYKHWYDNVEAYLEKKKNRKKEKLNKSKKKFKKLKLD